MSDHPQPRLSSRQVQRGRCSKSRCKQLSWQRLSATQAPAPPATLLLRERLAATCTMYSCVKPCSTGHALPPHYPKHTPRREHIAYPCSRYYQYSAGSNVERMSQRARRATTTALHLLQRAPRSPTRAQGGPVWGLFLAVWEASTSLGIGPQGKQGADPPC